MAIITSYICHLQVQETPKPQSPVDNVQTLSKHLGNITIVLKGENDIISDGKQGRSNF